MKFKLTSEVCEDAGERRTVVRDARTGEIVENLVAVSWMHLRAGEPPQMTITVEGADASIDADAETETYTDRSSW